MRVLRPTDNDMREAVKKLTLKEKEELIQNLWISYIVFENWLKGLNKIGNSKKRNQLRHLLGM